MWIANEFTLNISKTEISVRKSGLCNKESHWCRRAGSWSVLFGTFIVNRFVVVASFAHTFSLTRYYYLQKNVTKTHRIWFEIIMVCDQLNKYSKKWRSQMNSQIIQFECDASREFWLISSESDLQKNAMKNFTQFIMQFVG